jgi:hypothetical protein
MTGFDFSGVEPLGFRTRELMSLFVDCGILGCDTV